MSAHARLFIAQLVLVALLAMPGDAVAMLSAAEVSDDIAPFASTEAGAVYADGEALASSVVLAAADEWHARPYSATFLGW